MEQLEAEQSRVIGRPAADVWCALATMKGAAMPELVERMDMRGDARGDVIQHIQFSESAFMEQRLVHRDDQARELRLEMTASQGMPWAEYRSVFRIVPEGTSACRVSIRCSVATATATDAHVVRGMLRDLLSLSLDELAKRMEGTQEGSSQ